jgi:hypothetical protein
MPKHFPIFSILQLTPSVRRRNIAVGVIRLFLEAMAPMNYVTLTLLSAFVIVFLGTALVTLLGIAGRLPVKEKYLTMFASGLLLEVAAAMVWAFRSQDLSSKAQTFYNYVASVDVKDISPDSKTAEEKFDALLKATQNLPYRVWTVTGWTEFEDDAGDVNPENVYVNPIPFKRLEPNGTFSIDVLEQLHGSRMDLPNLVIDQWDPNYKYRPESIMLSAAAKPNYRLKKDLSKHTIMVDESVKMKKKLGVGQGTTAPQAIPISSPPPPPHSSSTPSPLVSQSPSP